MSKYSHSSEVEESEVLFCLCVRCNIVSEKAEGGVCLPLNRHVVMLARLVREIAVVVLGFVNYQRQVMFVLDDRFRILPYFLCQYVLYIAYRPLL